MTVSAGLISRLTQSTKKMPTVRSQNHNGALWAYFLEIKREGLRLCIVRRSGLNSRGAMMKMIDSQMFRKFCGQRYILKFIGRN
jgi:hypothetical protein